MLQQVTCNTVYLAVDLLEDGAVVLGTREWVGDGHHEVVTVQKQKGTDNTSIEICYLSINMSYEIL